MSRIGGLILAAGGSTRLGRPKQLLTFEGETLVHAAVRAAREGGCDPVCVVTGDEPEPVMISLTGEKVIFAHNENWRRGMGSSIRVGVESVKGADGLVILACDQPAVTGRIVRSLIETAQRSGSVIVASAYAGTLGIPVFFGRDCFDELLSLPDEKGAKGVIEADPARVTGFDFPEGERDLDTPEDLQAWRRSRAGIE